MIYRFKDIRAGSSLQGLWLARKYVGKIKKLSIYGTYVISARFGFVINNIWHTCIIFVYKNPIHGNFGHHSTDFNNILKMCSTLPNLRKRVVIILINGFILERVRWHYVPFSDHWKWQNKVYRASYLCWKYLIQKRYPVTGY